MQTLASKPIRRAEIVLGKWLGHLLVMSAYLALLAGGVLAIARLLGQFTRRASPRAFRSCSSRARCC